MGARLSSDAFRLVDLQTHTVDVFGDVAILSTYAEVDVDAVLSSISQPSVYLKRLYYDTVTFSPYVLRMLRDLVGSERMLMGSDYPHLLGSIDRAVPSIQGLGLPGEETARILGGNALRLLNNVPAALSGPA